MTAFWMSEGKGNVISIKTEGNSSPSWFRLVPVSANVLADSLQ